jgi:ferric-dicitrate binding protein FerR (iron transport regulator)
MGKDYRLHARKKNQTPLIGFKVRSYCGFGTRGRSPAQPAGRYSSTCRWKSEISVPLGQMSQVTLFDGTEVWLNSGTTLRYESNFGEISRDVSLDGEAYFRVRPGDVPFKVRLKDSEVEVFGTSFNVVSFKEENYSEVTLVEGSVKVNTLNGKEIAQLQPSEQLTLQGDSREGILKKVDTGFYMSWTEGKIVFEDERLSDVATNWNGGTMLKSSSRINPLVSTVFQVRY